MKHRVYFYIQNMIFFLTFSCLFLIHTYLNKEIFKKLYIFLALKKMGQEHVLKNSVFMGVVNIYCSSRLT